MEEIDNYRFPDEYFKKLEEFETGGSRFSIVQGKLYDTIREDCRYTAKEAMDVSRALNNGNIKSAKQIINENLEP